MTLLILGLVLFFAVHSVPTRPSLRRSIVSKIGEGGYRAAFAIIALVGLVLIVSGYASARAEGPMLIYSSPQWLQHVTYLLVALAFVLLAATYLPTGRIKAAVKHPMVTAIKAWALGHLLVNGDVASLILFGTFLAWAVYDRISLKARLVPEPVAGPIRNDIFALLIGIAAFVIFAIWLHELLIGVPVTA